MTLSCTFSCRVFGNPYDAAKRELDANHEITDTAKAMATATLTAKLTPSALDWFLVVVLSLITISIYAIVCFIIYGRNREVSLVELESRTPEERNRALEEAGVNPLLLVDAVAFGQQEEEIRPRFLDALENILARVGIYCKNFTPREICGRFCNTLGESIQAVLDARVKEGSLMSFPLCWSEEHIPTIYSFSEAFTKDTYTYNQEQLPWAALPNDMKLKLMENACLVKDDGCTYPYYPANFDDWRLLIMLCGAYSNYMAAAALVERSLGNWEAVQKEGIHAFVVRKIEEEKDPKEKAKMMEMYEKGTSIYSHLPLSTIMLTVRSVIEKNIKDMKSKLEKLNGNIADIIASRPA
ncbi:MAG: hypothetical protein LBB14_02900 [Puniceicoccales bacterium]|jgi:hypothetical protein|nr:hypothetical protein [Puniceicoccales bacterium]